MARAKIYITRSHLYIRLNKLVVSLCGLALLDSLWPCCRQKVPELFSRLRLQHAGIRVQGTPRRLAVLVASLACQQPDAEDRVRGPPAKVSRPCQCILTAP